MSTRLGLASCDPDGELPPTFVDADALSPAQRLERIVEILAAAVLRMSEEGIDAASTPGSIEPANHVLGRLDEADLVR